MALQWHDRAQRYGVVTRLLHWLMAALILWQLLGMAVKLLLGRVPLAGFFVGLHAPVGFVLFGLVIVRVIWALFERNRPAHGAGAIGLAARAGHGALYALMVVIPSLGMLRAWANTRAFTPFGIPVFPAREAEVTWAVTLADRLHGPLGWALAAIVAGHIGMVILHGWLWRDGTFARMAGRPAAGDLGTERGGRRRSV